MLFEIMSIIILILTIMLIYKLHSRITRTAKTIIILILILLAYVAFMNMITTKTYDLTQPGEILEATIHHVGGVITFITGIFTDETTKGTGKVIEEKDEEKET